MKFQKLFLGTTLSLFLLFTITPITCPAMENSFSSNDFDLLERPEKEASLDSPIIIFDFFGVLFCVDKAKADLEVPTPASPRFKAEATMCARTWYDMDLGVATKEQVAQEAAEKGQDYDAVVSYIGEIGNWVKPIRAGMEIFTRLKSLGYALLMLSNISTYCIAGIDNPEYFPRVNETSSYQYPDIFAEARKMKALGFVLSEGYSCCLGLGKPDVLCYKYFLTLNCPSVPFEAKAQCIQIKNNLLKSLQEKFECDDNLAHATEHLKSLRETPDLVDDFMYGIVLGRLHEKIALNKMRGKELVAEITRHRNQLIQLISSIELTCPGLKAFAPRCTFIDDSPRNLIGAEKAGINTISCQCHAVAYLTLVKKGLMPADEEYETLLDQRDLEHFRACSIEQLHDYPQIDRDLHAMHPENYQ